MGKIFNIHVFAILVLAPVCLISCDPTEPVDYCGKLIAIAKDDQKSQFFVDWVDKKLPHSEVHMDYLTLDASMIPAMHKYPTDIDWAKFGLNERSQARVVGGQQSGSPYFLVRSISFNEMSGYGLLVRHANSPSFGVHGNKIVLRKGRVAVFCKKIPEYKVE
jgi:hypothetical protein